MKNHNPAALAAEYMKLEKDGTFCPHGIDRFEEHGKVLVDFNEWVCSCCCHIFLGDSAEGMLCQSCA